MAKATRPIPEGYHTITPYLTIRDAARAIEFYKRAFGAEELMRMPGPGGTGVMHAELKIGDSIVMLSDESPNSSCRALGRPIREAHGPVRPRVGARDPHGRSHP